MQLQNSLHFEKYGFVPYSTWYILHLVMCKKCHDHGAMAHRCQNSRPWPIGLLLPKAKFHHFCLCGKR